MFFVHSKTCPVVELFTLDVTELETNIFHDTIRKAEVLTEDTKYLHV